MSSLIDSNVLLRFVQRNDSLHPVARHAIRNLRVQGDDLYLFLQNMTEFWSTATRPASARGGYGMTLIEADRKARLLERFIIRRPDPPGLYEEWRRLVMQFGVSGVQVHDARLVASCLASGITRIVTFNSKDFQRYASEGIIVIDPATI